MVSTRVFTITAWVILWSLFWGLLGWLFPVNVHNPFIGFSAPVLVFFVVFDDPVFTWPVIQEMYIPFLVFWLVFLILFWRSGKLFISRK